MTQPLQRLVKLCFQRNVFFNSNSSSLQKTKDISSFLSKFGDIEESKSIIYKGKSLQNYK
jgi:hypothetical protein